MPADQTAAADVEAAKQFRRRRHWHSLVCWPERAWYAAQAEHDSPMFKADSMSEALRLAADHSEA